METKDSKELIDDASSGKEPQGGGVLLLIVTLIPLLCFGYGAYYAYDYWDLKGNGMSAQAEVVRIEKERSYTSSEPNFYPVVRFEDQEGNIHEYRAGRSEQGKYKEGDKDKVYYDANNPERVILEGVWVHGMRAFLILMGLGGVGVVFLPNVFRRMR